MDAKPDLPVLAFPTQGDFEAWLAQNATAKGLWLKLARKDAGVESVSHPEAIESALCYGWIDSQARSVDSRNRYAVLFRLHDAKKPETRARRIEGFMAMLREGRKLHP